MRITVSEAEQEVRDLGMQMSRPTIIKHAEEQGYGWKVGGKWYIDKTKFRRFLNGADDQQEAEEKEQA